MTEDVPKVQRGSALLFWGTAAAVIVIDQITKLLAERYLIRYVPREIFGEYVRFTLAYNPGAAFSMSLGENSRYIFGAFALIALFVLWRLYRLSGPAKRAGDRMRILALGLAWGGAAGNLLDRIRSSHGVVDFIDVGVNSWRFWTFNVADSAVTIGAIVLAWSLSREDPHAVARSLRRPGEPVEPPQHDERDDGERAEDVPRVRTERHAERRARIVGEREPHRVPDDPVRHVARHEVVLRQQLGDQIDRDHRRRGSPEQPGAAPLRRRRRSQTRSPGSPPDADAGTATGDTAAAVPCVDWSSCHNTHASSPAPTLTAMSATLNVGQRASPTPTSMKSTTPKNERTRSIRLPTAPAHTNASATARAE
jgi:signal peptidase II